MDFKYEDVCIICDKKLTPKEREENTMFCDKCENSVSEEQENIKQWYMEEDKIIISDIPLFNQDEFNKLFKKYPSGVIESDNVEPLQYECYEDGVLKDFHSTDTCIFAYDIWNPNAMIPIVSIRKTSDDLDKIFIEKYMTKNEYEVEYLGEEDTEDEVLYKKEIT